MLFDCKIEFTLDELIEEAGDKTNGERCLEDYYCCIDLLVYCFTTLGEVRGDESKEAFLRSLVSNLFSAREPAYGYCLLSESLLIFLKL